MTEDLEQKKLCLEQLRLTKWQLIWNRQHETRMIKENDLPEVGRALLQGQKVEQVKKNLEDKILTNDSEIRRAHIEIDLITKEIEECLTSN